MVKVSKHSWLDRFLFSPLDANSVAWFRMALALVIPWFFWSRGFYPNASVPEFLHLAYKYVFISKGHYLVLVCLCGLLFVGWKPRLSLFLILLMVFPLGFTGSGSVSRPVFLFLIFAFLFVHSGTVRFPWREKGENKVAGPSWPIRLMQLELTVLYGVNAIAKSSPLYLSGDALLDMSATLSNFLVDMSSGYVTLGIISIPVVVAAVGSTLAEYTLAIGFWFRPWRWWVAAIGVGFHLVLYFVVDIHMLHYASIFLYLAFLLPMVDSKNACEKLQAAEQSSP